jgi:hypothetical protein
MSDTPLTDEDAIRQQLRASDDKRRQEAQRHAEEVRLQNAVEMTLNDFYRAVADARSHSEDASWRREPFDAKPHVPPITAQLREVLNVLRQARRLGLLDDIDLDETFKYYRGVDSFQRYPKDDCRKALDLAVMNLKAAASGSADFDRLVMELVFDASVEPAGKWFQMLLGMVAGRLRFEGKVKPGNPAVLQAGVMRGENDAADSSADVGGEAEEGEQTARKPDPIPPAASPLPASGTAHPRTTHLPKKSTQAGEAEAKLIAALSKHHEYAADGGLNLGPIGCNRLAREASVGKASASEFFQRHFNGYKQYRATCLRGDHDRILLVLKHLNGDFSTAALFGRTPPGEGRIDDE